jgi:DNA polymerase IV (archaeal DinB-like DNA polymerase)
MLYVKKKAKNGLDFSEVKEWEETIKSISRSGTFEEDTMTP